MSTEITNKLKNNGISDNTIYYWGYMYFLGKSYIVPHLTKLGVFRAGDNVAEIGSGEGGVLHSFLDAGSQNALGSDIAVDRLAEGKKISEILNYKVNYTKHDIINQDPEPSWIEQYNLVILRDVIEHLDNPEKAIKNIKKMLKKGGYLYITFPPFQSAYGGHQHTLAGNIITKLPFIHLLPKNIFFHLIKSGRSQDIEEVKRLKDIRFSPEKMEEIAINSGYEIYYKEFFIIRPVYKMKFGLNPLKLNYGTNLSFIRNFISQEAAYILRKKN